MRLAEKRRTIKTVPCVRHDDLNTDAEDHAADDWRYACMSRPWVKKKPEEEKDKNTSGYRPIDEVENVANWRTY